MAEGGGAPRRIALVGIMGAGKTAVGALLAERIGWPHLDLDQEVARQAGRSVTEIFVAEGEAGFRAREARATEEARRLDGVVLSTGGGWAAQRGLWDRLVPGTFFVWLRAEPAELLTRVSADGGMRPLLACADPSMRLAELLRQREPSYRRADAELRTDGRAVPHVVAELLGLLQARGILPPRSAFSQTQS